MSLSASSIAGDSLSQNTGSSTLQVAFAGKRLSSVPIHLSCRERLRLYHLFLAKSGSQLASFTVAIMGSVFRRAPKIRACPIVPGQESHVRLGEKLHTDKVPA